MKTSRRPHQVSLARALSKLGVCSRSEAVRLIEAGRVSVNGAILINPHRWVNVRTDALAVDGDPVKIEKEFRYVILNKPQGIITSRSDEHGRRTVMDLLGNEGRGLFPVGRLDKDSTGLLLLTNDHRLAEFLTNPTSHVPKTYVVTLERRVSEKDLQILRRGVIIELGGSSYRTRPVVARALGEASVEITMTEGKNRQLRRMFDALGYDVLGLQRTAFGALRLGTLKQGEFRELTTAEARQLKQRFSQPHRSHTKSSSHATGRQQHR